ncbi:hypothetical protein [Flavobacterium johnsoniae]|uniref:Uncharacterized protein n=1 Tax=Flavobacterium johnsoniae TaxID=986 RepID=A0A1M5LHE0_FLAJO|nr:hypothetical protein [Flavobacterium johnsoniae]SHG64554.1 hypothetical protein SAMN05444388_103471 [Flavobacterium johnsoniae]
MKQLIDAINSFQKLDDETEQAIKKYFVIEKFKKPSKYNLHSF